MKNIITLFLAGALSSTVLAKTTHLECTYINLKNTVNTHRLVIDTEKNTGSFIDGSSSYVGKLFSDGTSYWFTVNTLPGTVLDFRKKHIVNRTDFSYQWHYYLNSHTFVGGTCTVVEPPKTQF